MKEEIVKKVIEEKVCGECGELKAITEYDMSLSGVRRESICRNCKLKSFEPKKKPKIIGKSKPIMGFGSRDRPKEPVYNLYKPKIKVKEEEIEAPKLKRVKYEIKQVEENKMEDDEGTILVRIQEYVKINGDGFLIKEISKIFPEQNSSKIYANLKKLVDKGRIYRSSKEQTHRYFITKDNCLYFTQFARTGRKGTTTVWNEKILKDIRKGDILIDGVKPEGYVEQEEILVEKDEYKIPDLNVAISELVGRKIKVEIDGIVDKVKDEVMNGIRGDLKEIGDKIDKMNDSLDKIEKEKCKLNLEIIRKEVNKELKRRFTD